MKKIFFIIILFILTAALFMFGLNYKHQYEPNVLYQVYLEDEVLGVIKSKTQLEDYIDKNGDKIKKELGVDNVYVPNGIKIEKISTYNSEISSIKDIYNKIASKESFTVKGYQFTIRNKNEETGKETISYVYTTEKAIFTEAVENFIEAYIGKETYQAFINEEVVEIVGTGSKTENIYIDENITIKERYIPTTEKIYTNSSTLSQFLLYGKNIEKKTYTVKAGETIEQIAYNNEISVDELILSNPTFSKENQLVFAGQKVTIGIPDPQLSAVIEEYVVADQEIKYNTVEKYDNTINMGQVVVKQEGKNGLMRVTERIKTVNGVITYSDPISKVEIEPAVNKVIALGNKYIPTVGTTSNWHWPTESGCRISSTYGWRRDPYTNKRAFHGAIDIAGVGYNAKIYAATNGVVYRNERNSEAGNFIIINHNNGYYSQYNHMIKKSNLKVGATVEKGDVIGYVGSTGASTGPHLHFAVWLGIPYRGKTVNPYTMFESPACR